MSDPAENSFFNGDWDNQNELYWNEKEWSSFLTQNLLQQGKYLSLYLGLRDHPSRLDIAAQQMGWESGICSPTDDEKNPDLGQDAEQPSPSGSPYCVQEHPVYIVTRALFGHLFRTLTNFGESPAGLNLPPAQSLSLAYSLHQGMHHLVMSVTAMDTGDFSLAIALSKRALDALNYAMRALEPFENNPACVALVREFRMGLFDLRELSLRLINDAHWDLNNPLSDDE